MLAELARDAPGGLRSEISPHPGTLGGSPDPRDEAAVSAGWGGGLIPQKPREELRSASRAPSTRTARGPGRAAPVTRRRRARRRRHRGLVARPRARGADLVPVLAGAGRAPRAARDRSSGLWPVSGSGAARAPPPRRRSGARRLRRSDRGLPRRRGRSRAHAGAGAGRPFPGRSGCARAGAARAAAGTTIGIDRCHGARAGHDPAPGASSFALHPERLLRWLGPRLFGRLNPSPATPLGRRVAALELELLAAPTAAPARAAAARAFDALCPLWGPVFHRGARLGEIAAPVWLLWGARDAALPPALATRGARGAAVGAEPHPCAGPFAPPGFPGEALPPLLDFLARAG